MSYNFKYKKSYKSLKSFLKKKEGKQSNITFFISNWVLAASMLEKMSDGFTFTLKGTTT